MSEDKKNVPPTCPTPAPAAPSLDPTGQAERSLAFLNYLFDDAQDEEIEADGPISPEAYRLAAYARALVDALPRHIADGSTNGPQRAIAPPPRGAGRLPNSAVASTSLLGGAPSDGRPVAVPRRLVPDTGRIAVMNRPQLEGLVTQLHQQRGAPPLRSYDGISDDELREMARRLRQRIQP